MLEKGKRTNFRNCETSKEHQQVNFTTNNMCLPKSLTGKLSVLWWRQIRLDPQASHLRQTWPTSCRTHHSLAYSQGVMRQQQLHNPTHTTTIMASSLPYEHWVESRTLPWCGPHSWHTFGLAFVPLVVCANWAALNVNSCCSKQGLEKHGGRNTFCVLSMEKKPWHHGFMLLL